MGSIPRLGGGVDLSPQSVIEETEEAREWGERKVKLRCEGCGRRIVVGFEFIRVVVLIDPATQVRQALRSVAVACVDPSCSFAVECGRSATAVRRIDHEWQFLDDPRIQQMFGAAEAELSEEEGEYGG